MDEDIEALPTVQDARPCARVGDVGAHESKARTRAESRAETARQIVEREHLRAGIDEPLRERRSDEPSSAAEEHAQILRTCTVVALRLCVGVDGHGGERRPAATSLPARASAP